MATITVTLPSSTLQSSNYRSGVEVAIDELSSILEQFPDGEDHLSKRVSSWGKELEQTVRKHSGDSAEEKARILQELIEVLSSEILLNPMNDAPLRDPVIERLWTWERSMHAEYRNLFPLSPLDDEPMLRTDPPSHLFAQKMIAWMNQFTTSRNTAVVKSSSGQLIERGRSTNLQLKIVQGLVFQGFAQDKIFIEQQRQFRQSMDLVLSGGEQRVQELQEESRKIIKEAEANAALHEAEIKQKYESFNQNHLDTIEGLNDEIAAMSQLFLANISSLEKQMASMDQTNTFGRDTLKSEIANEKLKYKCSVDALNRKMDSLKQETEEKATRLENKIAAESEAHKAKLSSTMTENSREVSKLLVQLAENEETIRQLKASLQVAQRKASENKKAIDGLIQEQKQALSENDALRRKIESSGFWDFLK